MNEPWYASRRIWAGVFGAIGFVLSLLGYQGLDPTAQTALIDSIMTLIKDGTAIIAPILAIWSWFKPKPTPPAP